VKTSRTHDILYYVYLGSRYIQSPKTASHTSVLFLQWKSIILVDTWYYIIIDDHLHLQHLNHQCRGNTRVSRGEFKALRTMRPLMAANFGGRQSYVEYLFWFYKIMYIIFKILSITSKSWNCGFCIRLFSAN